MKIMVKRIMTALALFLLSAQLWSQNRDFKSLDGELTFIQANDLGRNGYYLQKPIAELMGELADEIGPECVIAAGDVHHFMGVQSVLDPLWMTNFEQIYSHPELMIPWYPVCGNHEYRGNTKAVLDYAALSRRWCMPAKYYTKVFEDNGVSVKIVCLDTTPLIDKYRKDSETYPDAGAEDADVQLSWLDSTLAEAAEDWVIVVGHHPIFADTDKSQSERSDMEARVLPILRKYNVDIYACGHIHNFQHIRKQGCDIDFVVNSSASLSRTKVGKVDGSLFVSGEAGFSVITADKKSLKYSMIDSEGKVIYQIKRRK